MVSQNFSRPVSGNENLNRGVLRLDEPQLLPAAKRGNSQAFEALCEVHRGRLLNAALRITRNREDAEDALQDGLLSAFVHIKDFHQRSSLSTWLTRIVINSALMIRRKNRNARIVSTHELLPDGETTLELQIPDNSPNPEQRYVEYERKKALHKAIARLRPGIRAAVVASQLAERSLQETAKVLEISVAATKGRLFHGRNLLSNSPALRAIA
ncbi:MAG TPA: RNA polymerase sigma factor [Candidatus Sulfotelmatobacter sp.]|nr:RNA polymerase sigma factor [Candidatus Sulfotelmatobacter sp.]